MKVRTGTQVLISPWVLHRHERLWDDPAAFRPERFLPGARDEIDRFAYIPFGAGPRICIGAPFAMQEAMIILSAIMRRLVLKPGRRRGAHAQPADHAPGGEGDPAAGKAAVSS